MKNWKLGVFILFGIILVFSLTLGACTKQTPAPSTPTTPSTPSPTPPAAKTIELTYACSQPAAHPQSVADIAWMEKIEKETNGQVHIEPFWGGALMAAPQALIEVAKGVADIADFSAAYMKEGYDIDKAMHIFFYGVSDPVVARRVYNEVSAKYPVIEEEFSSIKVLAGAGLSPYQLITVKKAVRKMDDLKGMTIKASGTHNAVLAALGAEGVPVPMVDTYVALQKGTIDGAMAPYETLSSFKFAEVVKYATHLNMSTGPDPHRGMNLNTWNSLPPDVQKVFEDNIEWWGKEIQSELYRADDVGIKLAQENKVEFIELSQAELDKYYSTVDKVVLEEMAKLDAKGIPGTEIYKEVRRLIGEYSK